MIALNGLYRRLFVDADHLRARLCILSRCFRIGCAYIVHQLIENLRSIPLILRVQPVP
jgi:hypothetical protein